MGKERSELDRRSFLAAGAGALALAGIARSASAAELTTEEQANVQLVNDFCAAWSSHELDRIMAFFADDGAYRMTETTELADGREAVSVRIGSFLNNVQRFDIVLDTIKLIFQVAGRNSFTVGFVPKIEKHPITETPLKRDFIDRQCPLSLIH